MTAPRLRGAEPTGREAQGIDISLLIPTLNGAGRLRRFLPCYWSALSVFAASWELIVVDDGSTDDTMATVLEVAPWARVIRHDRNLGASAGRNTAAAAASGEWYLLCDDDVELTAEALAKLWAARRAGVCLVPVVRDLGGRLHSAMTMRWARGDLKLVDHSEPVDEVAYPLGACFLLQADAYWAADGFDERFWPNGYEDVDFGIALDRAGVSMRMLADCELIHHIRGGDTAADVERSRLEHRVRNEPHIFKGRWLFALLALRGWRRWMVVGLGLPRTTLQSVRNRSWGPLRGYWKAWAVFVGGRVRGTPRHRPGIAAGR